MENLPWKRLAEYEFQMLLSHLQQDVQLCNTSACRIPGRWNESSSSDHVITSFFRNMDATISLKIGASIFLKWWSHMIIECFLQILVGALRLNFCSALAEMWRDQNHSAQKCTLDKTNTARFDCCMVCRNSRVLPYRINSDATFIGAKSGNRDMLYCLSYRTCFM